MSGTCKAKRILVVEDEWFIAGDLRRALAAAGAHVVGPVGTLAAGLALADATPLDAAVLDINLGGEPSFPIADRLAARGVPFLFLTGYDDWALPPSYRAAERLTKPCAAEDVVARLADLAMDAAA